MCLSQTALPPSITVQQVFDRTAFLCCNDTSPVSFVRFSICRFDFSTRFCVACFWFVLSLKTVNLMCSFMCC
jgi:hypothetical protein